eukprot:m.312849 g.312849  ORF g.312849 m.312849 type:complete len:57 (+) comp27470_c1_seq14:356-526(+)
MYLRRSASSNNHVVAAVGEDIGAQGAKARQLYIREVIASFEGGALDVNDRVGDHDE